jgi:hypothetical protein
MPYITSLIRPDRKRHTIAPVAESQVMDASASAVTASKPVVSREVFQLDYVTWHARLEGWNPIQIFVATYPQRLRPSEKVAKAA